EGCRNYVFSNGFCQRHQYLRQDDRYLKKHHREDIYFGFENQTEMFIWLWDREEKMQGEGRIRCHYTGKELSCFVGKKLFFSCFAHVLPKSNYPHFKLNPENIRIVHPEFHRIVDQGTKEDRDKQPDWKFSLWDQDVFEMKEKYREFKKINSLA
ncbi:MAG: hypothetical protein ABSA76_06210, partial [Bacteroidales bacterium]